MTVSSSDEFEWKRGLIDYFLEWLSRDAEDFIYSLVNLITSLWKTVITPALIALFDLAATLYVIFYAGEVLGETIMEIWDPVYYSSKPSEVFILEHSPQSSPLPTDRSAAKKMKLQNWS